MLVFTTKVLAAAGLLLALWSMSVMREPERPVWAHNTAAPPGPVRILRFRATVGALRAGEKAMLCYGVENAKAVHIAPPLDDVYPSSNHCVEIVPLHTTHYTILAEGYDGKVATESFTMLVVKPGSNQAERRNLYYAGILR